MRVRSFIKRLNATELGLGATNDTFVAIPSEVDLSSMLVNQQVIEIFDRVSGTKFTPTNSNIKYVQTGQNNQERISGLGKYFESVSAKVGDEILFEKIEIGDKSELYLDFNHRNAIVFQKNKLYVEILTPELLEPYKDGSDYLLTVKKKGKEVTLKIKFIVAEKKKKTSPQTTNFYDLIIDELSILNEYGYQDYIEILLDCMHLGRMKTYIDTSIEWEG